MKHASFPRFFLLIFLVLALAAGCAKKPAPTPADEAAAAAKAAAEKAAAEEAARRAAAEEAARRAAEMEAPKPEALLSELDRIHFDFDQYVLTPEAQAILAANAAYLKAHPEISVRVEGYCDERGSDEYNLALGERRALAAKNYLQTLGVVSGRIDTISYGEEKPLDPASTEEAWAKNRRDEFKIIK